MQWMAALQKPIEHEKKAFHLLTFVYIVSFVFEELFAAGSCIRNHQTTQHAPRNTK